MPEPRHFLTVLSLALALPPGARAESASSPQSAFPRADAKAGTAPIPYDDSAFARSQAEGLAVIVETYAPWCLSCRIQSPILERLRSQEQFRNIVILRIGEKTPNALWKRFKLHGYGMLIVFKGTSEVARGAPTNEAALIELLRSAN